jgi:hypothetical protein
MTNALTTQERFLLDRQEILDCVSRYCRAVDRHDRELLASVFHPDAAVDLGEWAGPVRDLVAWADETHRGQDLSHSHNITSHSCEIDGDTAHAESYVIQARLQRDGRTVTVAGGRYLDRLERRNGEWRIALRQLVSDWSLTADGSESHNTDGYVRGSWDKRDNSYIRQFVLSPDLMAKVNNTD